MESAPLSIGGLNSRCPPVVLLNPPIWFAQW